MGHLRVYTVNIGRHWEALDHFLGQKLKWPEGRGEGGDGRSWN